MEKVKSYNPFHDVHTRYTREQLSEDLAAALTEFLGTVAFLLVGLGGIQAAATSMNAEAAARGDGDGAQAVNTIATVSQLMMISASMGLALLGSAWIFFRVTGSAFNPNISLALWLCNVITFPRFIMYCIAQLAGSIAASALLLTILPGPLVVSTALGAGTNKAQGVWIEAFITAFLCLSVLMLAVEKHRATAWAPIGIALTLFACHLFAVVYTGAAMNVARAFGPAVVSGFGSDHWVYWVGDGIGSLLATFVYVLLKAVKYWKLNPDSDAADVTASPDLFQPQAGVVGRALSFTSANGKKSRSVSATDRLDQETLAGSPSGPDFRHGEKEVV